MGCVCNPTARGRGFEGRLRGSGGDHEPGIARLRLPVVEHTASGSRSKTSTDMVRPPTLYVIRSPIPVACQHPEGVNGLPWQELPCFVQAETLGLGSVVEGFVRLPHRAHDAETHFPCRVDPSCHTPQSDRKTAQRVWSRGWSDSTEGVTKDLRTQRRMLYLVYNRMQRVTATSRPRSDGSRP